MTHAAARESLRRRWRTSVPRTFGPDQGEVASRHRVVVGVLAAHLPLMLLFGVSRGAWTPMVLGLTAASVALVGALVPGRWYVREMSAAVGLAVSSIALQWMASGMSDMVLHGMVVAVLVSLYQDWRIQALTLVPFALWYVIGGLVDYPAVFGEGAGTAADVLARSVVRMGFLVAVMAASRGFWSAVERVHRQEAEYRTQLHEIEAVSQGRLRETEEAREILVATASHEFRTPLTTIRGNATTLRTRGDRLAEQDRDRLLDGIVSSGERLSRLLEDMLSAAEAARSGPGDVSDVTEELRSFAGAARPSGLDVEVRVPAGLSAVIRPEALRQILTALMQHAEESADRSHPVLLRAVPDRDAASRDVVEISLVYRGEPLSPTSMAHLFEPFGSREAARTGRPSSLRLYVMRRLCEVNGGSVAAEVSGSRTVLHVRLPAGVAGVSRPEPVSGVSRPEPVPGSGHSDVVPGAGRESLV